MSKNNKTIYFPHDVDSSSDDKIQILLIDYGFLAVGIFWYVTEKMHKQEDGEITEQELDNHIKYCLYYERPFNDCSTTVKMSSTKASEIKDAFLETGLFYKINDKFTSKRVKYNLAEMAEKRKQRVEAGIKSGEARQQKKAGSKGSERKSQKPKSNDRSTTDERLPNETEQMKEKGKEISSLNSSREELLPTNKFLDYQDVIKLYLSICKSLPKIEKTSDTRKRHIKARMRENTIEDFKICFSKAENSSWLKESGFCNFWWFMKSQENFLKTLEGNYDKGFSASNGGNGAMTIKEKTCYNPDKPLKIRSIK